MNKLALLLITMLVAVGSMAAQTGTDNGLTHGFAAFQAPLSPSAQVPPVEGTSGGEATILVHMTRDSSGDLVSAIVDFNVTVPVGEHAVAALHIHRGARGVNGPVVIGSGLMGPLQIGPGANSLFSQGFVEDGPGLEAVQAFLDDPGGHYVNLHTQLNPPGEIRGQLHPANYAGISRLLGMVSMLRNQVELLQRNVNQVTRRVGALPITE